MFNIPNAFKSKTVNKAHEVQMRRRTPRIGEYEERKQKKYDGKSISTTEQLGKFGTISPAITPHPTSPLAKSYQDISIDFDKATKLTIRISKLDKRKDISAEEKSQKLDKMKTKLVKIMKKYDTDVPEKVIHATKGADLLKAAKQFSLKLEKNLENLPTTSVKALTVTGENEIFLETARSIHSDMTSVIRQKLEKDQDIPENLIDLRTWTGAGDRDGNTNAFPYMVEESIARHQKAAVSWAHHDLDNLFGEDGIYKGTQSEDYSTLSKKINDFVHEGIGNVRNLTTDIKTFLDEAKTERTNDAEYQLDIKTTEEKLKLFPLTGAKIDIRQSSVENDALLITLIKGPLANLDITKELFEGMDDDTIHKAISSSGSPERKAFLKAIHESDDAITAIAEGYQEASQKQKEENPDSKHEAPAEWCEFESMMVAQRNPSNIDRYRISDGRDADDIRTLRIMEKAAQRVLGEKEKPKMDFIVLAETEADIERLPKTAKDILESKLNLPGKLTLFPGYSDAEKRMGITGLITIAKSIGETLENAEKYDQDNDAQTIVTISHGGGEDITRNGNKPKHDATIQGRAGTQLGLANYFKEALRVFSKGKDSIKEQAKQILEIVENPQGEEQLQNFLTKGRTAFRTMVSPKLETVQGTEQSDGLGLLTAEIFGGDFYKATKLINKSSRASAKAKASAEAVRKANQEQRQSIADAAQKHHASDQTAVSFEMDTYDKLKELSPYDLDKERAIGVASIFTASGTGAQVMMGMPTLDDIKETGVDLIKDADVVKDMMYKTLYTAAITDFDRATLLIGDKKASKPSDLPQEEHASQSIKQAITDGKMQDAKKMYLENMQIHAINATKAMAFVHGGDAEVKRFEKELQKSGATLASATQSYLKSSTDGLLKSLGISAEQMTSKDGAGSKVSRLLRENGGAKAMLEGQEAVLRAIEGQSFETETAQRQHIKEALSKKEFQNYENLCAFLMEVREEQTVPDSLNLFGAIITPQEEAHKRIKSHPLSNKAIKDTRTDSGSDIGEPSSEEGTPTSSGNASRADVPSLYARSRATLSSQHSSLAQVNRAISPVSFVPQTDADAA